jgi:poly-gamma-glutamate synthesis protein (capsule biosynthesis protein)
MSELTLFLSGDVMTGRGIDQVLKDPADPVLYERWARSALDYVALAEEVNGPIPRGVAPDYVWGDALALLDDAGPDARIINLETAVTADGQPWPGKGIHYRMSPSNAGVIAAAKIDCCVLANNHVLDWSYRGLEDTIEAVEVQGAVPAGAGRDVEVAWQPGVVESGSGTRIVVVAVGTASSGVDPAWAAGVNRPGLALTDLSARDVDSIVGVIRSAVEPGDIVVVSVHWGSNWGYALPPAHQRFAHELIDRAAVDIVHGHSSHHPLAIEVYRERLILYGCGDLINDYEGIGGHETYRPDLGAMYLVTFDPESGLVDLELAPTRMRRFRLEAGGAHDREWLRERLSREGERFGTRLESSGDSLRLRW